MANKAVFEWCKEPITGYIYFVKFGEDSPVKIGYTQNIDHRLGQLQIGNPYLLSVEIAVPGNEGCEELLHEHFRNAWIRGEWFWPVEFVERVSRKLSAMQKQTVEHKHQIRQIIKDQSGECLVDIVPGIKKFDLEVKQES